MLAVRMGRSTIASVLTGWFLVQYGRARKMADRPIQALEERLSEEARRLRAQAQTLPPGLEREMMLRKARQAETGSHMSEWLSSPGLQPPR